MKWLKVKSENKLFCPTCLDDKKIFFKRVKYPMLGFKSTSSDLYYLYKCENCEWKGDPMSILKKNEAKNIKRTRLIERMLK